MRRRIPLSGPLQPLSCPREYDGRRSSLGAGQTTQRMILRFQVTDAAYDGSVQPIVVQLTYMNQTRPLNLELSIYHPWVFWFFPAYMDTASNSWHPIPGIPKTGVTRVPRES